MQLTKEQLIELEQKNNLKMCQVEKYQSAIKFTIDDDELVNEITILSNEKIDRETIVITFSKN